MKIQIKTIQLFKFKLNTILISTFALLTFFNLQITYGQSFDNTLSSNTQCDCYTFVDECGPQNQLFIQGSVTLHCTLSDGKPWEREIQIDEKGRFCLGGLLDGCIEPSICLNAGNWEICDVRGCTISLFQTLPTSGSINGVGFGGYGSPGEGEAYIDCGMTIHEGALNTIDDPVNVLICPGDPVLLSIPNLEEGYGYDRCMTVKIYGPNGNLLGEESIPVFNEDLDLTSLFSNIPIGGPYKLEYEFCCRGSSSGNCTVNTKKYVYINVEGQFAYSLSGISSIIGDFGGGISVPFTPATSPIGPSVPFNVLTIIGYDVENSQGINVDMTLVRTKCDSDSGNDELLGTLTVPGTNPFSTGPFTIEGSSSGECECYRLDVAYDDGCGDGITTDSYYWKIGINCPSLAPDPDDGTSLRSRSNDIGYEVRVVPNPVGQTVSLHIASQYDGAEGVIEIRTLDGRLVYQNTRPLSTVITIDFPIEGGTYLYSVRTKDKVFSGKFVKM